MQVKQFLISLGIAAALTTGIGVGTVAGVKGEVKETKATITQTTLYIDYSGSYWVSASSPAITDIKAQIWGGTNGDVYYYSGVSRWSTIEVDSKNYVALDMTGNQDFTGMQVYCWDYSGAGNISVGISPSSFSNGKNLIVVGNSGSWSTNQPVTFGTLDTGVTYTVTQYGVYDGSVDSANPLGIDNVSAGATYAAPATIYKPYCTFGGWYSNSACTTPWSDSNTINADTSIYAKYTSNAGSQGSVIVDLKSSGWADSAHKYAIYLWNGTSGLNGWSNYVSLNSGVTYASFTYDVGFTPDHMIVVQYNSSNSESSWNSDKWNNETNRTYNIDSLSSMITIGAYGEVLNNKNCYNYTVDSYAVLEGKTSDGSWGSISQTLNLVKKNGSNHVEYYVEEITLATGSEFGIRHAGEFYKGFTIYSAIEGNITGDGTYNAYVAVGGTYSIYFDSASGSFYITDPIIAAADEWAQTFLGANCTATKTNWSTSASSWAALDKDVRDLFTNLKKGKDNGAYYEHAVLRYDLIETQYGKTAYTEFMGREAAGNLTPKASNHNLSVAEESNTIVIAAVASTISLLAAGGFFFFRKKKAR